LADFATVKLSDNIGDGTGLTGPVVDGEIGNMGYQPLREFSAPSVRPCRRRDGIVSGFGRNGDDGRGRVEGIFGVAFVGL